MVAHKVFLVVDDRTSLGHTVAIIINYKIIFAVHAIIRVLLPGAGDAGNVAGSNRIELVDVGEDNRKEQREKDY